MQYQGTDCKGYHVKVSYCTLVSAKQCYRQISYKLSQVPGKESYHRLTHTKIVSQKKKKNSVSKSYSYGKLSLGIRLKNRTALSYDE